MNPKSQGQPPTIDVHKQSSMHQVNYEGLNIDRKNMILIEQESDFQPTQEEILAYADFMGMDLQQDKEFLFIAREGLIAPLPAGWCLAQLPEIEETFFYEKSTGKLYEESPNDEFFIQKFQQAWKDREEKRHKELKGISMSSKDKSQGTDKEANKGKQEDNEMKKAQIHDNRNQPKNDGDIWQNSLRNNGNNQILSKPKVEEEIVEQSPHMQRVPSGKIISASQSPISKESLQKKQSLNQIEMRAKYFGDCTSPIIENSNEKTIENSTAKKKLLYEKYIAGEDSLSKYMTNQRRIESEEKQDRIGVEFNHDSEEEENKFVDEEDDDQEEEKEQESDVGRFMKDEGEVNAGQMKIMRNKGEKEELRVSEFNDNLNYSNAEAEVHSSIQRAASQQEDDAADDDDDSDGCMDIAFEEQVQAFITMKDTQLAHKKQLLFSEEKQLKEETTRKYKELVKTYEDRSQQQLRLLNSQQSTLKTQVVKEIIKENDILAETSRYNEEQEFRSISRQLRNDREYWLRDMEQEITADWERKTKEKVVRHEKIKQHILDVIRHNQGIYMNKIQILQRQFTSQQEAQRLLQSARIYEVNRLRELEDSFESQKHKYISSLEEQMHRARQALRDEWKNQRVELVEQSKQIQESKSRISGKSGLRNIAQIISEEEHNIEKLLMDRESRRQELKVLKLQHIDIVAELRREQLNQEIIRIADSNQGNKQSYLRNQLEGKQNEIKKLKKIIFERANKTINQSHIHILAQPLPASEKLSQNELRIQQWREVLTHIDERIQKQKVFIMKKKNDLKEQYAKIVQDKERAIKTAEQTHAKQNRSEQNNSNFDAIMAPIKEATKRFNAKTASVRNKEHILKKKEAQLGLIRQSFNKVMRLALNEDTLIKDYLEYNRLEEKENDAFFDINEFKENQRCALNNRIRKDERIAACQDEQKNSNKKYPQNQYSLGEQIRIAVKGCDGDISIGRSLGDRRNQTRSNVQGTELLILNKQKFDMNEFPKFLQQRDVAQISSNVDRAKSEFSKHRKWFNNIKEIMNEQLMHKGDSQPFIL